MRQSIYLLILIFSMSVAACSKEDPQPQPQEPPTYPQRGDLLEIQIKQLPEQLIYSLHSSVPINLKGLSVEGTYSDGKTYPLTVKPEHISGFSTEKENDHLPITIRIEGKEAIFYIQVVSDVLSQVTDDGNDTYTVAPHIREIGPHAFKNTHFTTIVLNEGLTTIGKKAFSGTPVQHINFPSTLKDIDQLAFYQCSQIKDVDLSQTQLTIIKESVFNGAGIQSIQLPSTLTTIEDQAFLRTYQLQKIELPMSVESIGLEAFRESGITHVVLPNNLRSTGKRAFMLCENLTTVSCTNEPATYTEGEIESSFFEKCPRLQQITYPESIRRIGQTQITENPKIILLKLPMNLQKIGFSAFDNCHSIERIEVAAPVPPSLEIYSLPKANKIKEIVVPKGSVAAYIANEKWKDYQTIIKE